ncbi:MAG: peptidyl-prolyl cis-trans isomerase [Candidatus Hydrogenedentes bacterium]|nr:peptidyl-prolyl cis-trans isomerase [Candidatus Hydrogenedentota bacterium]
MTRFHGLAALLVALCAALPMSCGQIADPDNIKVAKLRGKYITRGDLYHLLIDMSDEERPKIQSRQDLQRVLNQEIDRRIKLPLGQKLKEEGKIDVPRELAREQFFKQAGDQEQFYRSVWEMQLPENGVVTPLMEAYDLTPETINSMKELVELKTDVMLDGMLGDTAIAYLAAQDRRDGTLKVDEQTLRMEYNFRKGDLRKLEWMEFIAIRFPAATAQAVGLAAQVRDRIDKGESFDALVNDLAKKAPGAVIQSEIENNPSLSRFMNFWEVASGAKPGDILGPVYMPQYTQMAQDAQGKVKQVVMPDAYMVLKVLQYRPESELTLEESLPLLEPPLLIAAEIKKLRDEAGVEIYEDKLPDPGGGDATFEDLRVTF